MSKVDYRKEFPITHSAIIKMLRAKFRALSPLPNRFPASTTPKFSEKTTPEVPSITKRITLMYKKRGKRAKSAAGSANKMESSQLSISKIERKESPYCKLTAGLFKFDTLEIFVKEINENVMNNDLKSLVISFLSFTKGLILRLQRNGFPALIKLIFLFAQFFFEIEEIPASAFLFIKLISICDLVNFFRLNGNIFLHLGKISQKEKCYESAIRFFKKAVQYAWLYGDSIKEIEIYDLIGLCFFYLGETQKAVKYHEKSQFFERSVKGKIEPKTSIFRLSNESLLSAELSQKSSLFPKKLEDLRSQISAKLLLGDLSSSLDFSKYLELQDSLGKSMIGLYLNSESFVDLDEFYQNEESLNLGWSDFDNGIPRKKKLAYLHEKTEKNIRVMSSTMGSQAKPVDDSYRHTFMKNSKKLEKWNFSIFIKKLQKEEERTLQKRERSFAEIYENKRAKFLSNLCSLFQMNNAGLP